MGKVVLVNKRMGADLLFEAFKFTDMVHLLEFDNEGPYIGDLPAKD